MYLFRAILFYLTVFTHLCFANNSINLSKEELNFIENNPEITIGGGESFEPFIFKDENGQTSGYDKEITNLIEQKTGLKINFVFGVWSEIQVRAKQGELDGLSTVVMTKEREAIYNFSKPYLKYTAVALVNRSNHQKIYKKEDVYNKRAAVQRGNAGFEKMTRELGHVKIVYYDDIYSVLNAVVNNEVDFTILDESVYYVAKKLGISDFISTSFVIENQVATHFALTKRHPLLSSIFNKAIDDISPYQFAEIKARWFDDSSTHKINFTSKEKEYLFKKESISYCIDPDFYPIESNESGHIGVSADFMGEFQKHLSMPFKFIETDSWGKSLLAIKRGECDLLPMAMSTPQRLSFLSFSKPYLSIPLVIATKYNVPFISSIEKLKHKKIGIVKDTAYSEILNQQYPEIEIIEVENIQDGLSAVENGDLYGFFGALANISHEFQKGYSTKLKITGKFDEEWLLSIAVRKDDAILLSIFEKLVDTLSDEAKRNALNKYTSIKYESYVDYSIIYKILGLFFIILISVLLWNQRIQKAKRELDTRYKKLTDIKNKIKDNEERLQVVLKHGHIGNWELNTSDFTAKCSLIHNQIFGYDSIPPRWTYELFLEHVVSEDKVEVDNKFKEAFKNKTELLYECRIMRKDGVIRWILGSGGQELDNTHESNKIIGIVQDISNRKHAEEQLKLAANVFTHAAEGIVITDVKANIIDVNAKFTTITGYSRDEVIGKSPSFLKSNHHPAEFYTQMWQELLEKGQWTGEIWNCKKNNEIYAEMLTISCVKDDNNKIINYVGLFSDITLMKKNQEQLEHSAHYDLLTNLPNRALLADRLSQAILQSNRSNKSVAIVFIDLDGFKMVNDTHGHDIGDELLIVLSKRMEKVLREGDTLARIGGDEFVVVLADLDSQKDCKPILKRLLLASSLPIPIGNITANISSSVGVTIYPEDNVDASLLIQHADQAMYKAKQSGKNCYRYF